MNIMNATPAESAVNPSAPTTPTVNKSANAKVAIAWLVRSSDPVLTVMLARIIDSMTGNTAYPNPVPTLAAVTAARDAYAAAVNALNRGQPAQIRRNNARAAVVQVMRDLALYVQHACKGDLEVLVSSGFPAQKSRHQPVGVLDTPQNLRLLPGKLSGQLVARCKVIAAARSYQWRYATAAAPTAWTLSVPTTSSRYVLEGLTAGTSYIVQVCALGAIGPSNWSESATSMAM